MALAAAACVVCTAAALFLYGALPSALGRRRIVYLAWAGTMVGVGAWTTHSAGMLAFRTSLTNVGYGVAETVGSLALAIFGSALGLWIGSISLADKRWSWRRALGGGMVGMSSAGTHFLVVSGFQAAIRIEWDLAWVAQTVGLGAVSGALAFGLIGSETRRWGRQGAAAILAASFLAMHFTGMAAASVTPDPAFVPAVDALSRGAVLAMVVSISVIVLFTFGAGSAIESYNWRSATRRLWQAVDSMPEGVAIFDEHGQLKVWNERYAAMFGGHVALSSGMTFEELFAEAAVRGAFRGVDRDPAAWLALRLIMSRGDHESDLVVETEGGRWLRISERCTPIGEVVSTCVDVTELKAVEAELTVARDRAERLTAITDQAEAVARIGHYRIDIETRAVEWSSGFAEILGLPHDLAPHIDTLAQFTHPDDVRDGKRYRIALLSGEITEASYVQRVFRTDGELRYAQGTLALEHNSGLKPTALIGTLVDITDQKRAELAVAESEARFRNLAQNAPDMIAESDMDGRITYMSPACEAITGYAAEELLGTGFSHILHEDDVHKLVDVFGQLIQFRTTPAPEGLVFRIRTKAGEERWLESKPTCLIDRETDEHKGLIDVIRDVTSRIRMEAEVEAARAEAEESAAVKAEFLANMSHELRTPLTSIVGFIGLAAQQKDLTPQTRQYVERVTDASKALLCTVNDILDFSKLEAGQVAIRPEPVRLLDMARGALELFAPQAGAKDLDLDLDMDDSEVGVTVDPDRVRQILLNLVGNAVKFTECGGVTLRTRYDSSLERLTVEVVDTGPGIPAAKLEQLFKRFSQIDGSRSRLQGGTGLGLAICKGLAEAMGGQIGVESREGLGSRFWIEIPAPRAHMAGGGADDQNGEGFSLERLSVLVVDDHPANRELARLYLSGCGADVSEAEDGEAAAEVAAGRPFDVILMDLRMPRLDGVGALQRIRGRPGPNRFTPIVAFTADLTAESMTDLREMGFDGGVAKPIEGARLLEAVGQAALNAPTRFGSAAA